MNDWDDKRVGETVDYTFDWGYRIPTADTIDVSDWVVEDDSLTPVEIENESLSGKETTVWLSGGTANTYVNVVNTITTDQGRILVSSKRLKIIA